MATRVFGNFRALMAAAKSSSTSSAAVGSKEPKGILKVVPVSPQLSEFVGASEVSRSEAVKKVWQYIKLHNLQVFLSLFCYIYSSFWLFLFPHCRLA